VATLPNFTVLIPTRNRPLKIAKLLESLAQSSFKPSEVIVVASGHDIGVMVEKFQKILPITYIHTEISGQVNQKKLGLALLKDDTQWVAFLDDDLLLALDTFKFAFTTLTEREERSSQPIIGIGLNTESSSRIQNGNWFRKIFAKIFLLYSATPGSILKSGAAISYLDAKEPIFTKWLNGASIWRKENALQYLDSTESSKYAAYEDVFFSYRQSKQGLLIFSPTSVVAFQDIDSTNFELKDVYKSAAYLRMAFVLQNSDLSPILCAWSQIGRSLYALKQVGYSDIRYITFLLRINFVMLLTSINVIQIDNLLARIDK